MRTEITIPFAFDTTPIETMLQEHGTEEAMKILERMVEENVIAKMPMRQTYYGSKTDEPDWKRLMEEYFKRWLDAHTEEIIDEAALLLASRAGRKAKWRDVLRELKEEQ